MADVSKTLNDIVDVFSMLHDGRTSTWTGNRDLLMLKVNCKYLAERINKSYESFYIEIGTIHKIELQPWMNPGSLSQTLLTNIKDIFEASLEILSAEIENSYVVISCNQHDLNFDYCGGKLLLSSKTIKIFDQSKQELTIDGLDKICKSYWDDCNNKMDYSISPSGA